MTEDKDIVDYLEQLEERSKYVRAWKYCWDEREKARTEALEKRMAEISAELVQVHDQEKSKSTGRAGGELSHQKWQEAAQGQRENKRCRSARGKVSMTRKSRWDGPWRGEHAHQAAS